MIDAAARVRAVANFIGGQRQTASAAQSTPVYDPARGVVTACVPLATAADVQSVVASAEGAFKEWSRMPPLRRARILFKYRELLEAHAEEAARIITSEHGKTLSDARAELTRGIEVVEFACGIPHLLAGAFSENIGGGLDCWSMRQPLGVCAGITPFNFPAMVPLWMFPLAIACGNTFVLKPSERDPSVSVLLAELLIEAGAPPGVFNVVQGDRAAVDALLEDPRVVAVSFVGSTPIARSIYARGAHYGKRVQALGGAKNHAVVLPDADIAATVEALLGAAYGSAGERCMAISVVVAVGEIADRLVENLSRGARRLRVGPGIAPNVDMGPLVTPQHRNRVLGYIERGVAEGATLVVDGRDAASEHGGFFLGGTLFDNVTPLMTVYRDEIFGPVLCVVRAADLDSAIDTVNAHPYANGVAIFTRDGGIARSFAQQIHVGMVGVNVAIPVPMAFHSFGGWKHSMFGDRAMYGEEGVQFYTRLKTVTARWPERDDVLAQFSMPTH